MWNFLLMPVCLCFVSYSRCGLSGQECESLDSEEDEAGRSFGGAGTSAGGDRTGLLSQTLSDVHTPPSTRWSCLPHQKAQACERFLSDFQDKLLPFHLTWPVLVILGLSWTSNSDKRTTQQPQARRRTARTHSEPFPKRTFTLLCIVVYESQCHYNG